MNKNLYYKKIDAHCLQFQIVCTTNGRIIEIIGPFGGRTWDNDQVVCDMLSSEDYFADCQDPDKIKLKKVIKDTHKGK